IVLGWLVALSAAFSAAGCGTTRNHELGLAATPVPTIEAGAPPSKELPPDRAALLCLTVGAELEKNGYEVEAIEQYEKARSLEPRSTAAAHRLAVLHDRRGDVVRAQA